MTGACDRSQPIQDIIRSLKENSCTELELNKYEEVGIEECLAVIQSLEVNTSLQGLNLKGKSIGSDGSVALALSNALSEKSCVLETLSLENNYIGSEGCEAMVTALKTNQSLVELELYNNHVGNSGATSLANALADGYGNDTLKRLSLGLNFVANEGCIAFAKALRRGTNLELLDLGNNNIGDEGVLELANALKNQKRNSPSLKQLCLYGNKDITSVGLQALADMLESNHRMEFLSLDYWPRSELKSKIQFLLKLNRLGLRQINFDADVETVMNSVITAKGADDASILFHLIRQNPAVCDWMNHDSEPETVVSAERPRQRRRLFHWF